MTEESMADEKMLGVPLTLEAAEAGAQATFLNNAELPVYFALNGGERIAIPSGSEKTVTLEAAGDTVAFFSDNKSLSRLDFDGFEKACKISCSAPCYVYGNIMSLVCARGFESAKKLSESYAFRHLFHRNENIRNKEGAPLLLPATVLTEGCYKGMFYSCTGLVASPKLPAEKLAEACYVEMFCNCKNLRYPPELPAKKLADFCYQKMFYNCQKLAYRPKLPAKIKDDTGWQTMFNSSDGWLPARELLFDCLYSSGSGNGTHDDYGVVEGGPTIVFIKPGKGGSVFGRDDKYEKMGKALRDKFGCTVVCSANDRDVDFASDMAFVQDYAAHRRFVDWKIYYFGNSEGALRGLQEARKFPKIQRALLVNPPLMMDLHKSILGAREFAGQSMSLLVGSKDPSAGIASQFSELSGERFAVEMLDGVDHDFTGAQELFASLPEKLFE